MVCLMCSWVGNLVIERKHPQGLWWMLASAKYASKSADAFVLSNQHDRAITSSTAASPRAAWLLLAAEHGVAMALNLGLGSPVSPILLPNAIGATFGKFFRFSCRFSYDWLTCLKNENRLVAQAPGTFVIAFAGE